MDRTCRDTVLERPFRHRTHANILHSVLYKRQKVTELTGVRVMHSKLSLI